MIKELMDQLAEMGKDNTDEFWEHLKMLNDHGLINWYEVHYMMGKACGYAECCIKNFINLQRLNIPPAAFMTFVLGHKHIPGADHVLCPMCYEEALAKYDENSLNVPTFVKLGTPVKENQTWTKEEWIRLYNRKVA